MDKFTLHQDQNFDKFLRHQMPPVGADVKVQEIQLGWDNCATLCSGGECNELGGTMRKIGIVRLIALLSMTFGQAVFAQTAQENADDAAKDITPERFYSRPDATRTQYESDWGACRLIARGATPPSKNFPKNHGGSGDASVVGGMLGAAVANVITVTTERRFSRNNCMLTRGWRLYLLEAAERNRVQSMNEAERSAYFDQAIGARAAPGRPLGGIPFSVPHDPALVTDGTIPLPGSVYVGRKIDPAIAIVPGPNEAVVVLAFRRPAKGSASRAGMLRIVRYDMANRELDYPPTDPKQSKSAITYSTDAESIDRKAAYEVHVLRLTAGDYVIAGSALSRVLLVDVNPNFYCMGAPVFHAGGGQTIYIGDFTPFWGAKMSGGYMYGMGYSRHIKDARATLNSKQPELAGVMQQARMFNMAQFTCVAGLMDRWNLPGLEALGDAGTKGPDGSKQATP
jgi:hypothetical protein